MIECRQGDGRAFERIVQLWEQPLFYYLRRLAASEEDAWDLLQETWMSAFRSLGSLRDARALPAFLYTTARRAAIRRLRRRDVEEASGCGGEEAAAALDWAFVAFDDAEQVHRALDQLPLLQREALTLYFLQDLSIDEMAGVLGVAAGTVKSRLHYGKRAIRDILSNGDDHGT